MLFTDEQLAQMDLEFHNLPEPAQARINCRAAMLFCNLKMLGLGHARLPQTVPELSAEEVIRLRLLTSILEGLFVSTPQTPFEKPPPAKA